MGNTSRMGDRFLKGLKWVRRRLRRDGGFAVPTSLFMMLAALGIVSVGVVASVNAQSGTVRDQGTKSAVQVAEAAVNEALLHFNRIKPSDTNPCSPLPDPASASPPDGSGWCQAVIDSFNGAAFTYWVHPWQTSSVSPGSGSGGPCDDATGTNAGEKHMLDVVGTSTVNGATRRIAVRASASSSWQVFACYQVKAGEWIQLDSNAEIRAGTATNGDITLNSNARQCGQASVGVGNQLVTDSNAGYFQNNSCTTPNDVVNQGQLTLPSVNQGDADQDEFNQNDYFFDSNPISGKPRNVCWDELNGDDTDGTCGPRELNLSQNTAVTLQPGVYSFCKLTMSSNTALYVTGGDPDDPDDPGVTIYFDDPENCGWTEADEPVVQLEMESNSRITPVGGNPSKVKLLFVGNEDIDTEVHMSSNTYIPASCEQNFVLYAPLSDVTLNSNSTYCGGLAGKTLHLDSNARVWIPPVPIDFEIPRTSPHYEVERFVDCATAPQSPPDAGC
jgi:hypothetical protein